MLDEYVRAGYIDSSWLEALQPVSQDIQQMRNFLYEEQCAGRKYAPDDSDMFRAFTTNFSSIRVLIVGQDPYPTPGFANGLAFCVHQEAQMLPRSLRNMYAELETDMGCSKHPDSDLEHWTSQGVLLLNRVLSVRLGEPGSHRGMGWEAITTCAVKALVARNAPLVGMLWGAQARELVPVLGATTLVLSAHPSPLSASRGFFGSRPFSRTNDALVALGAEPIQWCAPE